MSEDIKNILQQKFEDFEPQPTKDLWAGIEAEIQPKRRVAAIWWYAAAAAVAIMIAVTFWPETAKIENSTTPIASVTSELEAEESMQEAVGSGQELGTGNEEQETLNEEQGLSRAEQRELTNKDFRNKKTTNPQTHELTNSRTNSRSFPIQPETPLQTKEAKPSIQLAAVALPAVSAISVAEAIPQQIDLQPISFTPEKSSLQSLKNIDLKELNPVTVVSLASETLDELGVRSPISYQQQKQKALNQKRSRFQLVLGAFSITHTSHKPI
jgi:hypothetical protein